MVQDTGNRKEFKSGALSDIYEGKGRCDLIPLRVLSMYFYYEAQHKTKPLSTRLYIASNTLTDLQSYIDDGDLTHIVHALEVFSDVFEIDGIDISSPEMFLEVSHHYEDGAKKYAPRNWEKGIPVSCNIDSCVRHLLKWIRGDQDERHDRAVVWRLLAVLYMNMKYSSDPEICDIERKGEEI